MGLTAAVQEQEQQAPACPWQALQLFRAAPVGEAQGTCS